MNHFQIVQIK